MFRLLLALSVILVPVQSLACGWFFPAVTAEPTTMEAQRVLMVWKKESVDVHVSVRASSVDSDFAWVLPVSDSPTLALGDLDLLDALDMRSRPRIEISSRSSESFGPRGSFCSHDSAAAGGEFGSPAQASSLQVESGRLGDYEYDIVKAETTEEMIAWLEEDGYSVPANAHERLSPYVAASMSFVWVKLSADSALKSLTDLQPLILTVPRSINSTLSFPLALSAGSASETMSTQFFILADKRYRATNYPSTDLTQVAHRVWEERFNFESYEQIIDSMTDESGGRLMVTEFAGDLRGDGVLEPAVQALLSDDTFYLTRLSARTRSEELRDVTITYANEAPDVSNFAVAEAPEGEEEAANLPLLVLAILAGLWGWRRRHEAPANGH